MFSNVLVVVQVTAVCVLFVFIAPLLTVGLLPTTSARASRESVNRALLLLMVMARGKDDCSSFTNSNRSRFPLTSTTEER